jgi:hypothetical protein
MRKDSTADRRIEHAKFVVLLPFVLTLVALGILATVYLFSLGELRTPVEWGSVVATGAITATYGFAAWLISQRRAAGGYLAIVLFSWTIVRTLWLQQITFNTIYSIIAIAVIMRAADELNFKWRLPSPR